jgi:hypothetical protein
MRRRTGTVSHTLVVYSCLYNHACTIMLAQHIMSLPYRFKLNQSMRALTTVDSVWRQYCPRLDRFHEAGETVHHNQDILVLMRCQCVNGGFRNGEEIEVNT